MLILAAAAQNLCLWSCLVCSAAPYLTSLCLSLCEPFTSLLLLSFPPRPRRPWVYSLEVALWGGWGGGVYMVGATLWCPHHWLLWIWRVRRYECVTRNNSLCPALWFTSILHFLRMIKKDAAVRAALVDWQVMSPSAAQMLECLAQKVLSVILIARVRLIALNCLLKKSYRGRIPQQNTAIKVFIKQTQT